MPESLVSPNLVVTVVGMYLLALLLIGVYSYRQSLSSMEDFFIVSRGVGVIGMTFTILATILSLFFYLGISASFLQNGIGWMVVGSWQILTMMMFLYVGTRIWKLGNEFGFITPAEMYSDYYDSRAVNLLVPIVYTIAMLPFFTLQMRGMGLALSGLTGGAIPFTVGVTAFIVIVVIYQLIGGARAVVLTDVFQGIAFVVILAAFFFLMITQIAPNMIGQSVFHGIAETQPDNLTWPGSAGVYGALGTFALLVGAGMFNIGQGPVFQRFFMAENRKTIEYTALVYTILTTTLTLIIFYLSLGSSLALDQLPQSLDQLFPVILGQTAPILGALFVAGALAAGMSTIDSNLLSLSSFYSIDVFSGFFGYEVAEDRLLNISQGVIIGFAIIAYILALRTPATLTDLALLAIQYSVVTTAPLIGPVLGWKHASSEAASLSLIIGALVATAATFISSPLGIDPSFWSIFSAIATFIIVGYLTDPVPKETRNRYIKVITNRKDG